MKQFLLSIIGALVLATGCARFNTARATAYTFFTGQSSLASWKGCQTDKTQGAAVGNLTQEANAGTNLTALVETVIGAAVRAAVKP